MDKSNFQFVTFQNADDFKSKSKKRAVRSHVVRRTFANKKDNFRNASVQSLANARPRAISNSPSPPDRITAINREMLDPFECLPVSQFELQLLLSHPIAQQAVEPVFSISDPYTFHNLHGAFPNAFTDEAFSNALMCAISLAKNNYIFTPDVLYYQGAAIDHINQRVRSHSADECTIGAILLLIGVEWRTMTNEIAQVHLRGIKDILQVCEAESRTISATVRRGIFWQDLNTAIVSGKNRVLDRATFPEFQWGKRTFKADWVVQLPRGFEGLRHNLCDAVVQILQDICVLQKHSEALEYSKPDIKVIDHMDNMQACLESRMIEQLHDSEGNQLQRIILLTVYLYTYSLFTQIWNGCAIPLHISSRLLRSLQNLDNATLWETQRPLMLWCTTVAGCLTPESTTRTGFGLLFQVYFSEFVLRPSIHASWFDISGTLDRFLWSQAKFGSRAFAFLQENTLQEDASRTSPVSFGTTPSAYYEA